ncbi:MAG: TonB-dependent receptor [Fidelibacterota bacterium]|nr:MAG: TonB-dependent receptor [Candidatus Neomarinimicrobiota bacterium]
MNILTCLFASTALLLSGLSAQSVGALTGQITDIDTHQPLVGANIVLEGTNLGAAADAEGRFRIVNIPVGSYTIRVMMMGYKTQARANIHVVPQRETVFNMALEETILLSEGVTITAGFFERAKDAVVSTRTVDIEEMRSDPVGSYDMMMMMQALPSVASGGDHTNEIIVRGGGPGENLFVIDHLEIPYPNHFPIQGFDGGAITAVRTEFVERIDFYAGAFPARFGGRLSSVMDVTLREGSRTRHMAELDLGIGGVSALMEGPLTDRGSYLVSLSKSFLDLVMQTVEVGISAVPRYSTVQGKLVFDLTPRKKLKVNFLGMLDAITIEGEKMIQAQGIDNVNMESNQYTVGVTYKDLFSLKGYSLLSLGHSRTTFDWQMYRIGESGARFDQYLKDNIETETTLKGDWVYIPDRSLELSGGFKLKYTALDYADWAAASPQVLYGYAADSSTTPAAVSRDYFYQYIYEKSDAVVMPLDTLDHGAPWSRGSRDGVLRSGLYGQINWQPTARLELIAGARAEYMELTKAVTFSPRLGLSYHLSEKLKLNASAGRYYQTPYYDQLIEDEEGINRLRNYYADQAVLGLEFLFREDVRTTLEGYYRAYDDMAISDALTTLDTTDTHGGWVNAGAGHAYGIELFVQKKFSSHWYGTLSYARSVAEGYDPRYPGEKRTYPWDYDYGDMLTIIGGYKIKYMDYDWYNRIKDTFWFGALSFLPFWPSDEFEASFRIRYIGGAPYTPKVYDHNLRKWYNYTSQALNTERYDYFLRFDIMFNKRFYYKKMNLVIFLGILNVFNRDNPLNYAYLDDGTREKVLQFKMIPSGGVTLEF